MATALVGSVVALIVGAVVAVMIRDKKNHKSSCGGNCAHCACGCHSGSDHSQP